MKKLITLALALVLAISMSVCSFAAVNEDGGSESVTVTGKFQYSGSVAEVIVVDVAWEGTEWVYNATKAWSDIELKEVVTGGTWTNTNASGGTDVTITNKSNIKVYVDFVAVSTHEAAAVAFMSNGTANVADVEVASAGGSATQTLVVSSVEGKVFTQDANIATITVTIKKAPASN